MPPSHTHGLYRTNPLASYMGASAGVQFSSRKRAPARRASRAAHAYSASA